MTNAGDKIDRIGFIASAELLLVKSEAKHIRKFNKYFKQEYFKGIDDFIATRNVHSYPNLFKRQDIEALYVEMYIDIAKRFYKWYESYFRKYIAKQEAEFILNQKFREFAERVAGNNITLVQGSRKKRLIEVLKTLYRDPQYQFMNERDLQRVLRRKFSTYSKYEAQRLVRTEANAAANYGSTETASAMFGKNGYVKEWLTAMDGREREWHARANGQIVKGDGYFIVKGERLRFPSDPKGSGANIINCRCQSLCYPPDLMYQEANPISAMNTAIVAYQVIENENL